VIILPDVERIPLETLRKLADFARGGGVLIATRRLPSLAPGLQATEEEQGQVREITRSLFEGPLAVAHFVEDEKQLGKQLASWLQSDISFSAPASDIGFVHRRTKDSDIYFIANTGNTPVNLNGTFRIANGNAEWWEPISGKISKAKAQAKTKTGTTIALNLEPYASRVLVFSRRSLPQPVLRHVPAVPAPIDLSSGWKVSFGQDSKSKTMDHLESWTEDEETRYFSGVATYEKDVTVPKNIIQSGLTVRLDFGEAKSVPEQTLRAGMQAWLEPPVREAAVIYINDVRAGSVWMPPYSLDVTAYLKRGNNHIKIVAGNLAVNYMAGHSLPDYRLLNLRYGLRFEAQDMDKIQPVPAGLLGPIRLVASAETVQ
jgi:hypothetical protein